MKETRFQGCQERREAEQSAVNDQTIVEELIKALAPYPGGLRRWSVMRAIRSARERMSWDVSLKFEDEIERVFRRYCSNFGDGKPRACSAKDALFHRPVERAGEVWAVYPEKAAAWLGGNLFDVVDGVRALRALEH
jgi:hypothetical protein